MPDTFDDLHPDQQQMFDDLREPHTLARATDPDTSHQAATMRRGTQRWRMLDAFRHFDGEPVAWDRAAKHAGIHAQSSPWTRCSELSLAGLIRTEGVTKSYLGADATAYVITDEGRQLLVKP